MEAAAEGKAAGGGRRRAAGGGRASGVLVAGKLEGNCISNWGSEMYGSP